MRRLIEALHLEGLAPIPTLADLLLGALCMAGRPAEARKVDSDVSIGYGTQVWSETLREPRRLLVYLPPNYEQAREQRYPVLYLLDAEAHFHHATGIVQFLAENGRIPQLIVVGVTNTQRGRDLAPSTHSRKELEDDPDVGGAGNFLKFLSSELAPWVEARFRTSPYRILVGHSFGGLFNVYALTSDPQAFQAHIAISPSLWWDEGNFAREARVKLASLPGEHFLYLSWGDREPTIRGPTEELVAWLEKNPPARLTWKSRYYAGDDHGTTPHRSLYDGLEALYDGWLLPDEIDGKEQHYDLPGLEAHAAQLSRRYGYPIVPSPASVDAVGEELLDRKDFAAAIPILQRNAADHGYLPYVHESLGKALEGAGRPREALEEYRKALALALDEENPYSSPLDGYRKHVKEIEQQLQPKPQSRKK